MVIDQLEDAQVLDQQSGLQHPPTSPEATASAGAWPKSETRPASGRASPRTMSMVVDFPAPFGPRSANELTLGDLEGYVVDRGQWTVALGQMLGDDGAGWAGAARLWW